MVPKGRDPLLVPFWYCEVPFEVKGLAFGPGGGGGGWSDSDPFWTGCVNTILKEMGAFSASSEWHEWINFHSTWVSYWPGHSIWVPFAFITHIFYSKTTI